MVSSIHQNTQITQNTIYKSRRERKRVETIERGKKQKGEEGKKLLDGSRGDKERGWRRISLRVREGGRG